MADFKNLKVKVNIKNEYYQRALEAGSNLSVTFQRNTVNEISNIHF